MQIAFSLPTEKNLLENGKPSVSLGSDPNITATPVQIALNEIALLDERLEHHFKDKLIVEPLLTRPLVSFQANKKRPIYRWYKYKEAFSASLVEYLFNTYEITSGKILDPFAGVGTSLFTANTLGLDSDGIELLPIATQVINARLLLTKEFTKRDFEELENWVNQKTWKQSSIRIDIQELRITAGAYPPETRDEIEKYLGACQNVSQEIRTVLQFALLCVLELMSYTRKDGQYLRWDYRSGRQQGKVPFDKGIILSFDVAITSKIREIIADIASFNEQKCRQPLINVSHSSMKVYQGSCLKILPTLADNTYDAIITSPPYCNRYDYTRTYALELALLGVGEGELVNLRQELLSCTVENRAKDLLQINPKWTGAIDAATNQALLQRVLEYLEYLKNEKLINNMGIPRMVRGYFYELACVINECSRVLKPNAPLFMVNDNVRYAGAGISVDMILSHMAEQLGFTVENILVLPNGKGNSSQQMGEHGRTALRKCVYVWRKKHVI